MKPLFIRTDAHASIGIGHFMRCFALGQSWKDQGGQVVFVTSCKIDSLLEKLKTEGFALQQLDSSYPDEKDLDLTLQLLNSAGSDSWLVLDGYHFDSCYQERIKKQGYRLLVIDDMAHLPSYHCDILLNQNLGAEKLKYNCNSGTTLLLGSRYALLRQEFLTWRGWQRRIPDVAHKVLVTMGGGDPDNVTLKVIHALEQVQVDGLEAVVVVSGSNPHYEILQSTIRNLQLKIRLERNTPNMPELMAWADVAITAGGSTCWETIFMGLPSVVLTSAENQNAIAKYLHDSGLAVNLGWHEQVSPAYIAHMVSQLILSPEVRDKMVCNGQAIIDGLGGNRIVKEMVAQSMSLRQIAKCDCDLLWDWANDPDVRASAFCSKNIPIEEHRQWFLQKLEDPQCVQFIGMNDDNQPIGQVRFDIHGNFAEVDISVSKEQRGKGYSSLLIRKGVHALLKKNTVENIYALVKTENQTSLKTFHKAGFVFQGLETVKGQSTIRLAWNGNE